MPITLPYNLDKYAYRTYVFSNDKRGSIMPSKGKIRITLYIDDSTLDDFRSRAEKAGTSHQTMMNNGGWF